MADQRETWAYFFVREFDCSVDEISRLVGFDPTEAHPRNELLPSGRRRKSSSWNWYSSLARDTVFVSDHLEDLLPQLESHRDRILDVGARHHVGLQCVGYYTDAHPGFSMNADLVRRIAALGLSVDFDLYCFCDDECSKTSTPNDG